MWSKLIQCLALLQDPDVDMVVSPDGQWVMSCVERLSNILHNISNHSTYISVY